MKRVAGLALLTMFTLGSISPAHADASADLLSAVESMKQQMTKMQETIERQNARIAQLESNRAAEAPAPQAMEPGVEYQPKMSEKEWDDTVKSSVERGITWMKGLKFGGDARLRWEAFQYDDNNSAENVASDRSRNRFRMRLRFGFEKDYMDDWKVGFRLASATAGTNGVATDNTSTNVTFGNPGYFTYKNIYIDRMYAQYSPNGLKDYGMLKGVTIGAGKFENPFLRYSTTIVWDADVTPEGAYEKANVQLYSDEENKLNFYGLAGQFITHENSGLETDAGLTGWQGALNWSTYNFGTDQPVDFTGAVSYYDYYNWAQTVGATNNVSTSFLRTNTLLADDFRVLDIYPEIVFYVNRVPVTLWYNYVVNTGNVGTEDSASLGNDIHDQDEAWGLGLKLGKLKKKGDWEAFYGYYEIGANSTVAAFADSDFGGPGGQGYTNRQGHKFGVGYLLTDAITLNWTGYVVTPLNPNGSVANSLNETVFRSQADVVYKF